MPARGASAKRYAQAAFEIAQARNTFDRWQQDLGALATAAGNADFVALLEHPRLAADEKRRVLKEALPDTSDEAINLATVLTVRGRFQALAQAVAMEFERLWDRHRDILRAEVVTAVELDRGRVEAITRALSDATGKAVQVTTRIDPSLLGGMVVRLGDRVVDGSVRSRLRLLRRSLG